MIFFTRAIRGKFHSKLKKDPKEELSEERWLGERTGGI